MNLEYKISSQTHNITFCKKNSLQQISNSLEKIKSDKNILFIYDGNVNKKIVNLIVDELRIAGCNLTSMLCKGEKINKNEKFLFNIIDILLKKKFTKKSVIVSCGGGVIGDVSALASSLYLRGLFYFCIPTTMTAIVDSSIGGKTAINYKGITNSVGTYFHPKNVFIIEDIIKTLPQREFLAGIAEVIKCGLIDNNNILSFLEKNKKEIIKRNFNYLSKLCELTLKTKIKFFQNDIFEKNERLFLNFGHTFAHAIEMAIENHVKKDVIRHGEAVSLGILCELFYANKGKSKLYDETKKILSNFLLPVKLDMESKKLDFLQLQNNIYKNIFLDKKKIDQYPRYISLKKKGKPSIKPIKDFDFLNDTILKLFD